MIHFLLFILYMKFFSRLVTAVLCIMLDKSTDVVLHIVYAIIWGVCINSVYGLTGSCHV